MPDMSHRHLNLTQEHYTPELVVEAARAVLGAFDLDPASCAVANERVRAVRFIGLPDDGLAAGVQWSGRVFLNPPGGSFTAKRKNKSDPKPVTSPVDAAYKLRYGTDSRATAWWYKLTVEYSERRCTEAIFVGFNLEILRSTQGNAAFRSALRFPFCVPAERLRFGGDQPTHANAIVYLGSNVQLFAEKFQRIGEVRL